MVGKNTFRARIFPVMPNADLKVEVHLAQTLATDGQGALLRPEEGTGWQFRTRAGTLVLEDSIWIDGAGRPRPSKALVVTLDTPDTGVTIPWSFRRVR